MRTKDALGIVLFSLFLNLAGSSCGFAQTDGNPAGQADLAALPDAIPGNLLVATHFSNLKSEAGLISDESAAPKEESATVEAGSPNPRAPGQPHYSHIGIGVKVSTLGAGIEAATPLTRKLNVRGGFNMMRLDHTFTDSGIQYNGQLRLQSAEAHVDWFPFWGFHVSPGLLFYNGNHIAADAMVPGGQTFTISGTTYESDPTTPVTGTGKLDFVKVAPSLMLGVGNLIPRSGRHFSFLFEAGAVYEGSARVSLNLAGNVCDTSGTICRPISTDPTVQANVQGQQVKIQNDVNPYRFFPVVSIGVGFNF